MPRPPLIDLDIFPPFNGFPREGIQFLKQLKRNNNRQWFAKHKSKYETFLKLPMQSLIAALRPHFAKFTPEIEANPKRSMFRIYRDIRFSKDKSPYKTHVAAAFHPAQRASHWRESAGYYLHIEPGEVFLGGGMYMPDSNQLRAIRKAIVEKSDEFVSILEKRSFKRRFGKLQGDTLQRVPQGYPPDHPMADWLKFKQFFVYDSWHESKCYKAKFVEEVADAFKEMNPLVRFLNEAIA